jgi:hypothetical protein
MYIQKKTARLLNNITYKKNIFVLLVFIFNFETTQMIKFIKIRFNNK